MISMPLRKRGLSPQDLDLVQVPGGTRLRLRVKPGARADAVLGVMGGALKVSVKAPPERGKANSAALELLAEVFEVPAGGLKLFAGATSQSKKVLVPLEPTEVAERLRRRMPGRPI